MSTWTCSVLNQTEELLSLVGFELSWGSWHAEPPRSIGPSQVCTWTCDMTFLGQTSGVATYVGKRGTMRVQWDVPAFGDPTYRATVTDAYVCRRAGSLEGAEEGGTMFVVTAPPAPAPPPRVIVVPSAAPPHVSTPAPAILPSGVMLTFLQAVLRKSWKEATENANGLSMTDMLRAMATLDRKDLKDFRAESAAYAGAVYLPRIHYAIDVIEGDSVAAMPHVAPGDLEATGQVGYAKKYLTQRNRKSWLHLPYDLTNTLPLPLPSPSLLTVEQVAEIARDLKVETAALRAIAEVESSGAPFGPDGRPIVRFELHVFHSKVRATSAVDAKTYEKTHPHLCQHSQDTGDLYHGGGQTTEWGMLHGALALRGHTEQALSSASYGKFQVMGFNHAKIGWPSVTQFVRDMFVSEANQFKAFMGYVEAGSLVRHIRSHDWASFAHGYNGAGYLRYKYDTRMAAAYDRFRRAAAPSATGHR